MPPKRPLLKNEFYLPENFAVYVPSTTSKSRKIAPSTMRNRVDKVRAWMSKVYGGTTSIRGVGTYTDEDTLLIKENVVVVQSFSSTQDFHLNEELLYNQIMKWGRTWGQESMGYEYEGDMYYIEMRGN